MVWRSGADWWREIFGNDKRRDDIFAATPPLEAKRMLLSRAATITVGSCSRKLLLIDAKKAHLNPCCRDDIFIGLPEECGAGPGVCGKLDFWLMGSGRQLWHGRSFILAGW